MMRYAYSKGDILAEGTIYQLRRQYNLDNAPIELIGEAVLRSIHYWHNLSIECTNNYYIIRAA